MKKESDRNTAAEAVAEHPGYFRRCKAEDLGVDVNFAECITGGDCWCPYRMMISPGHYCEHPNWKQIVKQTGKQE